MGLTVHSTADKRTARADGLRTILAWGLLGLAGLLPVCLLSAYSYRVESRTVQSLVRAVNRSTAQVAAEMVDHEIEHSVDLASAIAISRGLTSAVERHDEKAVRERLQFVLQAFPRIDRAYVVDPQGVLWADYPVAKESLGHSFAERDYFRGLARTWTPYVSEVFRRQADPKALVVAVAVPIRSSDQKVLGGLVYQIRLEQLSRRIAQMHVGGSGYVVVLDHEGRVVAHPKLDLQAAIYGDYAPLEPTQNAMVGKESTVHYTDPLANRAMVASFVPVAVGQNHWVVIAQQPADEAYAPLRRLRWQLIVATGIIAVATLAVVLGLGHTRRQLRLTNRSLLAEIGEHKIAEDAVKKEQDSLRQLLDVYERHRQLAAFEIHDGLAQPLAAALMNFESLKHACAQDSAASGERFAATLQLLRDSMAEARRLMTGLRPPILDDFGVIAAIDHLVEECRDDGNVEIEWSHETKFNRLAAPLETALYRIVQEGLSNALRHSNSRRVGIRLTQRDGLIHAEIEDWGQGFDPGRVPQDRFGLQGIRERAKVFGGRAVIDSAPGRGTRIAVVLPVIERVATEVDDALEADDE